MDADEVYNYLTHKLLRNIQQYTKRQWKEFYFNVEMWVNAYYSWSVFGEQFMCYLLNFFLLTVRPNRKKKISF